MMEKELSLKQLTTSNISHETQYAYSYPSGMVGIGKKLTTTIIKPDGELLLNPIIIMELDETSDLEFDVSDIFKYIELEIGGSRIDKLYSNQLKIYQAIKGYEIKKVGSKIFYPIPFDAFNKDEGIIASKCKFYEIRLGIEFTSNPCIDDIKDFYIRTDVITTKTSPDYVNISNYYIKDSENKDGYSSLKEYLDKEDTQIVKIKQNQFYGIDSLYTPISNQKFKLCFNHLVDKFFIYFENTTNGSIFKLRTFDKISFIVNGWNVLEYDYETLVHDNDEKNIGYKLPIGVYQIDWCKFSSKNLSYVDNLCIELNGITIPNNNIGFCICANSINYLKYESDTCRLYFSN